MRHTNVNLLPQDRVEALHRLWRGRVIARVLVALGIIVVLFGALVGTTFFYISTLITQEESRVEAIRRSQELEQVEELEARLRNFEKNLEVIRTLDQPQYDPSEILRTFAAALPPGVRLTTVNVVFEEPKKGSARSGRGSSGGKEEEQFPRITLFGNAATRGAMLAFERSLEELPFVAAFNAPIQNLIEPADVDFSFTLTLEPLRQ